MDTWMIVCAVVILLIACLVKLVISTVRAQNVRKRNEWLEALLVPSVSLAKLVNSLNTVFPWVFMKTDKYGYNRNASINLRNAARLFSDSMMWKLIDVFVRNADTHFQVLSNGCEKDGASLVRHIMTEIMELHGTNAMKAINDSSLSKEAKQKLLS